MSKQEYFVKKVSPSIEKAHINITKTYKFDDLITYLFSLIDTINLSTLWVITDNKSIYADIFLYHSHTKKLSEEETLKHFFNIEEK